MVDVSNLEIKIHAIATDGLPDMSALAGRVAFIFDGNIVSGWPLLPEGMGDDADPQIRTYHDAGNTLWEADSDVGNHRMFGNVSHWVEFPKPLWEIAANPTSAPDHG